MFRSKNTKHTKALLVVTIILLLNVLTLAPIHNLVSPVFAATPEEQCAGVPQSGGQYQDCLDSARRTLTPEEQCAGVPQSGGQYQDCLDSAIRNQPATPRPQTTANPDEVQYVKNDCSPKGGDQLNQNNCGIIKYLVLFIKFLSGLVGIVVVISIIIGGIQYSASGGDPNGVNAAKKRIFNAILALAVYAFIFAILQFLIPGGVFAP